jgi:glycine/D-amino acid oxidase-like deaminating enzyme
LALFQRACQNCHSENTQWPWYSRIPPVSWVIGRDVDDARRHVNFSNWDSYWPEQQEEFLTRIGSAARTGQMPLPRYTLLHREAVLASQERQQIYAWSRAEKKRLRAAGSAEIAGFDATPMPARVQAIIDKVLQTFPQFARCYTPGTAKVWAGLRPVSPSGVGYMGRTSIRNLFVNAGHGHLGWTMSCGAGRLVADIVAGRKPEIDLSGFPALSKTPLGCQCHRKHCIERHGGD